MTEAYLELSLYLESFQTLILELSVAVVDGIRLQGICAEDLVCYVIEYICISCCENVKTVYNLKLCDM